MSQCIVPNWNLNHQRQEQGEADQERNRSSTHPHVHSDHNLTYVVPMGNYEVAELTWENGQLALHGLGGMGNQAKQTPTSTTTTTTTWEKPGDHTLESIVHQATFPNYHQNIQAKMGGISTAPMHIDQNQEGNGNLFRSSAGKWRPGNSGQGGDFEQHMESLGSMAASASSAGKWRGNLGDDDGGLEIVEEKRVPKLGENPGLVNKRIKMRNSGFQAPEERAAAVSACASASATFCRDQTDTTMMTWNSFESPMSLKSGRMNGDDDSACHLSNSENQEGERMNKGERRRSRAAAIHNQSERRRRDRINEKMRALQKLVPNASKTDKASMLDEVIEYLKQLQAQVQMMSSARNMPVSQMMMPLGMQQQQLQQQMSLLAARMGMGIGMGMGMGGVPGMPGMPMGMFDVNAMARNVSQTLPPSVHGGGAAPSSFVSPPFAMAPVVPNHGPQLRPDHHATVSNFNDAYQSFIAQQSMNMDFFNKMAAMYRQQATHQTSKKPVTSSQPNNG